MKKYSAKSKKKAVKKKEFRDFLGVYFLAYCENYKQDLGLPLCNQYVIGNKKSFILEDCEQFMEAEGWKIVRNKLYCPGCRPGYRNILHE